MSEEIKDALQKKSATRVVKNYNYEAKKKAVERCMEIVVTAASKETEVSRTTLFGWVQRYRSQGLEAL